MTLNKSKWINRRAADWLGFSELAGLLQKDWRGEILYADGLSGAQKKQNCWMTVNVELSSHLSSSSQIVLSLGTNFIFAFCQSFAEYQFCLKKKKSVVFFSPIRFTSEHKSWKNGNEIKQNLNSFSFSYRGSTKAVFTDLGCHCWISSGFSTAGLLTPQP